MTIGERRPGWRQRSGRTRSNATMLALLMAMAAAGVPGVAVGDAVETPVQAVAARLAARPDLKGKTLGLGDLRLGDGRIVEFGVYLADKLDVALVQRSGPNTFTVVNRSDLCQVVRENGFWLGDQFDPALAAKLGRAAGIDFLITGRITVRGSLADAAIRVIDTALASVLTAESMKMPLDADLQALLSKPVALGGCAGSAQLSSPAVDSGKPPTAVEKPGQHQSPGVAPGAGGSGSNAELTVKVRAERSEYSTCETVEFDVRTSQDAYVALLNIGTSGGVTMLFPNGYHQSHFVRAGQSVTIPPAGAAFRLVVRPPGGFEQVRAIASAQPFTELPAGYVPGQRAPVRSLDRPEARAVMRNINVEKAKVPPTKWAEDLLVLRIRDTGKECK